MAGECPGDHRNGPMCVPGDESPWGIRWTPGDPEPWPGFADAIASIASGASWPWRTFKGPIRDLTPEQLYVFVHAPATSHPTTSGGRGSYSYWPIRDVAGRCCYVERQWETGSWSEEIVTIHVSPSAPAYPGPRDPAPGSEEAERGVVCAAR